MSKRITSAVTVLLVALFLAGPPTPAGADDSHASGSETNSSSDDLRVGANAFVRIKEYETAPDKKSEPQGDRVTLSFGDTVTLRKKSGDLPTMWLVSANGEQGWIPEYYLTLGRAEIDFLRKQKRIPATLTFVCKPGDHVLVCGTFVMGPFRAHSIKGMGASNQGNRQVGFEHNAVIFHKSVIPPSFTWKNPILMTDGNVTHELRADAMYYCREVDDKRTPYFDCINLQSVEFARRK